MKKFSGLTNFFLIFGLLSLQEVVAADKEIFDPLEKQSQTISIAPCLEEDASDIFGESISFSSSGFHFFYHLGVAKFLQENYNLSKVRFLGTSGGALAAIFLGTGIPFQELWDHWHSKVYEEAEKKLTGILFNLGDMLKEIGREYFSEGMYKRLSGRVILSATGFMWGIIPYNKRLSHWNSNEEVMNSAIASAQIPFFINKTFFQTINGERYVDGALTGNQITIDQNTICVSPYMWSNLSRVFCLFPHLEREDSLKLLEQGYQDAKAHPEHWARLEKYRLKRPDSK